MRSLVIIIKQVYKKKIFSLGYLLMVFSPVVLVAMGILVFSQINTNKNVPSIAIISNNKVTQQIIYKSSKESTFHINNKLRTNGQAQAALKHNKIKGIFDVRINSNATTVNFTGNRKNLKDQWSLITSFLNRINYSTRINESPLNATYKESLYKSIKINVYSKNDTNYLSQRSNRISFITNILCIFFSMLLIFYCQMISQEVVSEKGTHILEIILSSITPTTHFLGKISGVILLLLTQVIFYILLSPILYFTLNKTSLLGNSELIQNTHIFSLFISKPVIYTIIFGFLGIYIYIVVSAVIASAVSRQEQVGEAITPVLMLALVSYYGGVLVMSHNTLHFLTVSSYIPLISQNVMPIRFASATASNSEAIISIMISLVFSIILTHFAIYIYKRTVFIYNDNGILQTFKTGLLKMKY
ncbi:MULTISPECIES: ABC transporter permease [Latilactobacillus]|uniref:ABC transporter permease n=1 Tax=Latilactobacillus TaxID=2767885 RepID=UPI000B5E14A8|nr:MULTISPECIES: ABC transporter permease [Latilactobacillus]ASN13546.1 hypothetical protein B4V05_09935 [Latilactobacillus sakei]MCM1636293.1 ABC transporter permease [Latilactobacillus sakei]MCW8780653.1 ABC transporter permease [Latilactobacillus curvatus]USF99104.1 hypothetical protein A4W81_09690 [Latilactobacillus sakei]UTB73250.1 hypothetical protein A4W72_10855 [Latilactobacillus curvatus]